MLILIASPRRGRGLDPAEHLRQIAVAGDVPEPLGIAAVEADVDAANPGASKIAGEAREPRAVGRHRQLVEAVAIRAPSRATSARCPRRTSGSPPVSRIRRHAAGDEAYRRAARSPRSSARRSAAGMHRLGHAIAAAQIAAVGHRQADIGDAPPEAVDHVSRGIFRLIHGLGCSGSEAGCCATPLVLSRHIRGLAQAGAATIHGGPRRGRCVHPGRSAGHRCRPLRAGL